MRTRTTQNAQPQPQEIDRQLRSSEIAVLAEWNYPPMSLYFAYSDGDYWIGTGYHPPRRASSCGWGRLQILDEIEKADEVTRMKLIEAPMGHLIQHCP